MFLKTPWFPISGWSLIHSFPMMVDRSFQANHESAMKHSWAVKNMQASISSEDLVDQPLWFLCKTKPLRGSLAFYRLDDSQPLLRPLKRDHCLPHWRVERPQNSSGTVTFSACGRSLQEWSRLISHTLGIIKGDSGTRKPKIIFLGSCKLQDLFLPYITVWWLFVIVCSR